MVKKIAIIAVVLGVLIGGLAWMFNIKREQVSMRDGYQDGAVLQVVTTSTMVTDMVRIIGGKRVHVHGIMAPGVDPHSYTVNYDATAALKKADLVFYSGLHLEGKIQHVLEKKDNAFAVTASIPKEKLLKPQEEFDGYHDPHVWGDPSIWAYCVDTVVVQLSKADPGGVDEYKHRAGLYYNELMALHEWAKKRIAEVPKFQRVLVTSHDAFYYFGKAFDIEVKGLQGVSTNSQAGLRDRADLVQFIRDRELKMVFPESSVNAKGLKAVAEEAGVKISARELFSDAMGKAGEIVILHGETYDKGTYVGMIKHNVNSIVDGLR